MILGNVSKVSVIKFRDSSFDVTLFFSSGESRKLIFTFELTSALTSLTSVWNGMEGSK